MPIPRPSERIKATSTFGQAVQNLTGSSPPFLIKKRSSVLNQLQKRISKKLSFLFADNNFEDSEEEELDTWS